VGGAKTPATLIDAARHLGVPVYEGYGLTECGSVVSLNLPGADRVGTVGKSLPGVTVRARADGELEVAGRPYVGYLGSSGGEPQTWFATGDLGAIDADGFVTITGRKKNVLVTSFGRNISPEWPESLLLESPHIAQAGVFGDAQPYLVAVVVAAANQIEDAALEEAVQHANLHLPDYARIRFWIRVAEPFTPRNGLATANGRIRRDAVSERYADQLIALYDASTLPSFGKGATGETFIKTSS
jgi:long-subunit acyl-CoA synthetase (AMP-forming)